MYMYICAHIYYHRVLAQAFLWLTGQPTFLIGKKVSRPVQAQVPCPFSMEKRSALELESATQHSVKKPRCLGKKNTEEDS